MIKDLVAGFQKAQHQHPSIIQDNYKLKEGIYIRLKADQSWEQQSAAFEQNHLIIRVKEDEPQNVDLLKWFKIRDYSSSLVEMNKSVDPKKQVHGNNPYTLFVKRDVYLGLKQDVKSTMTENIERYLSAVSANQVKQKWVELIPSIKRNGVKKKENQEVDSKEASHLFQDSETTEALTYLDNYSRLQWIEQITQWYRNNATQLTVFIEQLAFKNYVKLFFTLDSPPTSDSLSCEQIYKYEYILYTIPKIYNSNDYNQVVNEELIGLPSFDMTMNSKKPYMEHRTMRIEAPDRVPIKQAMLAKETAEWLAVARPKYSTNKFGYESGFVTLAGISTIEGTLHVYMDGKDNELHGFENVPFPPTVSYDVKWFNFLQLKDRDKGQDGDLKYYGTIQDAEMLQKMISSKFFRGRMNVQFVLNDPPDVKNKEFTAVMVALFLQSRQGFHDWFFKGTTISIRTIFANVTLRLLEEQLLHVESSWMPDLADAFNLRLSINSLLDEEGGGNQMADRIESTVARLSDKLVGDEIVICSSDEEFYFMSGQLAYYLIYQSEAKNKKGNMYEPFLRARNGQQLKKRLEEAYMLYKHGISLNHRKFNHAFSMVMGYEPEQTNEGNARELFLAGLFADNLLF